MLTLAWVREVRVSIRIFMPRCLPHVFVLLCALIVSIGVSAQALEDIDRFDFSVRMAKPVALPKDTSTEALEFLGPGLASGVLGMTAPPMFASGLVMGGLILVPGSLLLSSHERKVWQQVVDALRTVQFERELLRALQQRATQVLSNRAGQAANVELIVKGYGFVGGRSGNICFIASADLVVRSGQDEFMRSNLSILEAHGSVDAPPAQCASMERFAEHGGQMVLDSATEYAEILAAMAIDRLSARMKR